MADNLHMKNVICILVGLVSTSVLAGDSYVHGYVRRDGTYVQGYHRTTPDNTVNNNYGTQGNVNPYTGSYGTQPQNPYQPQGQYNLGNGLGNQNPYKPDGGLRWHNGYNYGN